MTDKQTEVSDLLKPRYKVIADFPLSACAIGQIFTVENEGDFVGVVQGGAWKTDISAYPHLFKRLEWWEERSEDELPKYLKYPNNGYVFEPSLIQSDIGRYYETDDDYLKNDGYNLDKTVPATKEEYESFINQNKQKLNYESAI